MVRHQNHKTMNTRSGNNVKHIRKMAAILKIQDHRQIVSLIVKNVNIDFLVQKVLKFLRMYNFVNLQEIPTKALFDTLRSGL